MPSHHHHHPSSSVHINDLLIQLPTGLSLSSFSLPPSRAPCTIILSLSCHLLPSAIPASAVVDDLPSDQSVNYSVLSKKVYRLVREGKTSKGKVDGESAWRSLEELGNAVTTMCIEEYGPSLHTIDLTLRRPKALLFSRSVSLHLQYALASSSSSSYPSTGSKDPLSWQRTRNELSIDGMTVDCVLGLNAHEREEKQQVEIDVRLDLPDQVGEEGYGFDYKTFGKVAQQYLIDSSFQTIESLIHNLTHHLLLRIPTSAPQIYSSSSTDTTPSHMYSPRSDIPMTVEISKPHAIAFASSSSVRVTRCLLDYPNSTSPNDGTAQPTSPVLAWIAIGSNIGDRIRHVSDAVNTLCELDKNVKVTRTSGLYESKAMYVEDQADFLNGAFEIETTLSPVDLLLLLKRTEKSLGRVKTMVNGPRVIDLDLLFYDVTEVMGPGCGIVRVGSKGDKEGSLGEGCGWLEVPHGGVAEREFVLRPLCDFANSEWRHPMLNATLPSLLSSLTSPPTLKLLIPFHSPLCPVTVNATRPLIMGILNITPDSFSDGDESRVSADSLEQVVNLAKQLVADGANILDVGGMSTRPGVTTESVTEIEELSRVIPVIQALWLEDLKVPISIDTFRPVVAEQAILAGASCINDVRGGKEEGMLEVMVKMNVPVVLMHSRGDSVSMTGPGATDYSALGGVVRGVRVEMEEMVERAELAGVKRWNIILDPGIGFAKSVKGNVTLLRNLDKLAPTDSKLHGYPMLVGASRKRFIGTITGKEQPKEREYGNAAVTSMCCGSGVVHVIRVHEPGPAKDVISMWAA